MDYMGGLAETPALSDESLTALMRVRAKTFMGFMEREHNKGIMFAPFDLRTPKGQDVARLLFWRTIEEYAESLNSVDIEHRLEELIDSFNYISAALLFAQGFESQLTVDELRPYWIGEVPTYERLGLLALELSNVTETFRNRAWMENSQSNYFDGLQQYRNSILFAMRYCCRAFKDWNEFWRYFMAKDAVLQFRLRSNY